MDCNYLYKSSIILKKLTILVDTFENKCQLMDNNLNYYPFNSIIESVTFKIPKINKKINQLNLLLNDTIYSNSNNVHYTSIGHDDLCMLCKEPMINNITRFECGHYIHRSCYFQYKYLGSVGILNKYQAKCPYCQKTINYINNIDISDHTLTHLLNGSLIQLQIDENINRLTILKNYQSSCSKLRYNKAIDLILTKISKIEEINRKNIIITENSQFNQIIDNTTQSNYVNIIDIWYDPGLNYSGKYSFKKNYKNIYDLVKNSNDHISNDIINNITLWILFRLLLKNNIIHHWINWMTSNLLIINYQIPIELDQSFINWNDYYLNMSTTLLNNIDDFI